MIKRCKMKQEYIFNSIECNVKNSINNSIKELNVKKDKPIFICIGSDLVLGDSLGPLVGTMLKNKRISPYIYGTLNYPITAHEVEYAKKHLKQMHPNCLSIAIDAAVGNVEDIGLIKVLNKGLMPGLGVNKKLSEIGDISIIGVVAEKSLKNYNLFNLTRLNLVYKMAEQIADGIELYIKEYSSSIKEISKGA